MRFTPTANKKGRKRKKTATMTPTNNEVGGRAGWILALRTARVNWTVAGTKRGRTAGMFRRPATSELLTASGSSLCLCGGGGRDVAGRDRLPRKEVGKDSSRYSESGSGSLARFRRGEIRPGFGALAIVGGGRNGG